MVDRMAQAERDWMAGRLDTTRFFAMAEREVTGPRWWARMLNWWDGRRR